MERSSRSVAEQTKMLESFESSGMSASAFAARAGIPKGTLYNWLSKARRRATARSHTLDAPPASPVRVAKVVRRSSEATADVSSSIVIEVGGVRIELGATFNPAMLTTVLDVLEARSQGRRL